MAGMNARLWDATCMLSEYYSGLQDILSYKEALGPTVSYQIGTGGSFPGESGRGVQLITQLHLVPRLKKKVDQQNAIYNIQDWCCHLFRKFLCAYCLSTPSK